MTVNIIILVLDSHDRILLYGVLVIARASKLDIIILVLVLEMLQNGNKLRLNRCFYFNHENHKNRWMWDCPFLFSSFGPFHIQIYFHPYEQWKTGRSWMWKPTPFLPSGNAKVNLVLFFSNDPRLFRPISVKLSSFNLGFLIWLQLV